MKRLIKRSLPQLALAAILMASAPATARVVNFLNVPGPIELSGKSYELAWSSKPSDSYIKQEYVPAGQTVEHFYQMLMIERATGDLTVSDALAAQIDMLKKRKSSDPLVNFEALKKEGSEEVVLDFLLSAKDAKGSLIVEWNLYRYTPTDSGIALFAVSHRAYGDKDAKVFLTGLKQLRTNETRALLGAKIPVPRP